jgi:hypothetical protein
MATLRFPNRTGQAGIYYDSTTDYVDVDSTFAAEAGMVTFAAKATDDSWASNDLCGLLVKKDNSNYQVWLGKWVSASETFEVVILEESVGTLTDEDDVIVTAVLTNVVMDRAISEPQIETETGTTRTLGASDKGKVICCTSGSAVTITVAATLAVNFHCMIVQEGAGKVSLARDSTDTLNGGTGNVSLSNQWKSAYLFQRTEGAWTVIA